MKIISALLFLSVAACSSSSDTSSSSVTGTPVLAYQDRMLSYALTSTATGAYVISGGLPSWASFNAATGTLSGVPTRMADGFDFTITQHQTAGDKVFGPFTVQVVGNPLKEFQWHLLNTGQSAFASSPGTAGQDIHLANSVSSGITGLGVKVAISDSGVVIAHEALKANVINGQSRNYLNNYAVTGSWLGDPTPDESTADDAHGTAVSSLALEAGWNGVGGRGVAPEATFAGFLFIQAQDTLGSYLTQALNDQYAGAFDVFNYSWGEGQCELTPVLSSTVSALSYGVTHQRGGLGSLYFMAAGNSYIDDISECYPNESSSAYYGNANFSELQTTPYIMNVGAINATGVASSYSTPGANIWISAPGGEYGLDQTQSGFPQASEPALIAADFPGCGVGLKTLDASDSLFDAGGSLNSSCNYTSTMNGTSGATPLSTGTGALILQANPALSWRDVKYVLAKTADMVDPAVSPAHHPNTSLDLSGHVYEQGWITNHAGFHFMNYYGFGRVNVDNAVALAKTYVSGWGPLQSTNYVDTSGNIALAIPDFSAAGVSSTITVASALNIEAVQLQASISHCIGDMGLELTSPQGTKSIILNTNSRLQDGAIANQIFLSNAFFGETNTGVWTLKVIDGYSGCTANLTKWSLNFFGH